MRPGPGRHPAVPFVPPVPPACYAPNGHLLFTEDAATDGDLLFVCEHYDQPQAGSVPVPIRRVYFVINEVTLTRWPDGTPVPVLGLSLSLWALTDWLVPTGVFAKQGTWIEALITIVGAAGGYLLPHPSEKTLRVRHRYPVVPWDWWTDVTPDFVLPVDTVGRESLRWIDKPAYNRVFVAGQEAGVLGQVTRTGTAGDVLAPMVVDALITQAAVARQRGIAVLADTGRQIEVTLRLPVLPETGIIEPGAFIAYQDGGVARLGLVRSTRIDAGLPEVWQTLGVQSYA